MFSEANRLARNAARRLAGEWEPELRIAIDALLPCRLPWRAFRACQRELPFVEIRLHEETLSGTWEAVIGGRADLAIGVDDPPACAILECIGHVHVEFVHGCAVEHPLAAIDHPVTVDELQRYPAVVVADSARQFSPRSIAASLLKGQRRLVVSHMSTKLETIRNGLGVGHCPRGWVTPYVARKELKMLELASPRESIRCDISCRREQRGKTLDWFIDQLDLMPSS